MVRSGRSPGLTPTDWAAAAIGLATAESPAAANPAEAPRKLRRDRFSFIFSSPSAFVPGSCPLICGGVSQYFCSSPGASERYGASGRANDRMFPPAAMATYCRPSTAYVIGEALMKWLVSKCQRYLPVRASTAANPPLLSPKKTRSEEHMSELQS